MKIKEEGVAEREDGRRTWAGEGKVNTVWRGWKEKDGKWDERWMGRGLEEEGWEGEWKR